MTEPNRQKNPVWNRDELILALDLYMRLRPSFPGKEHSEVIALSTLLIHLAKLNGIVSGDNFRNPNGVAMKLQNFRRFDPSQKGKGLPGGGKGEEEVWKTFANDPERLHDTVKTIKAFVENATTSAHSLLMSNAEEGEEAEEGKLLTRVHRFRERNRDIVAKKKGKTLHKYGALLCEACGFNFNTMYGDRGKGFIECHHTKPLSKLEPGEKTKLEDLALLCANCHRMIHVNQPWLTVQELKELFMLQQHEQPHV